MPRTVQRPGIDPAQPPGGPGPKPRPKHPVLGQARRWCREAQPIFICGPARSGTSILTVSLARHSRLFTPRGVAETFAFADPPALLARPVRKGVRKYLGDGDAVRRFQALVATVGGADPLPDADIVRLFFFFAGTAVYPGLRPLEKTPSHVSHLRRLFAIFPHARVVVSLRDPVDIVSSFRKRLGQEQAAGADRRTWGWLEKSPERLVHRFYTIARDLAAVPEEEAGKVFLAPYGWVTADPATALETLTRFLDLPVEPGMADGRPGGGTDGSDDEDEPEGKRLAEPITARASERHNYLSAEEIAFVEGETATLREEWRHHGTLASARADAGAFLPEAR